MAPFRINVCGWLLFLCAAVGVSPGLAAENAVRPNILLIVTDDQRADTIHALGNQIIRTPNLDRLVSEGTVFRQAIAASPLCTPSRAELLTGRNGLCNGRNDFGITPKRGVPALARTLAAAGYESCYTGKWHTEGKPADFGYSKTAGLFAAGKNPPPLTHPSDFQGRPVTGYVGWTFQTSDGREFQEQGVGLTPDISRRFADAAIEFVNRSHTQPFFLHVNFTAPHDPLLVPPGMEKRFDPQNIPLPVNFLPQHPFDHGNLKGRDELLFRFPRTPQETREEFAVYYAVIEQMDSQIGRLIEVLQTRKQLDNTLIIFTSDHGLAIGSHGLRGKQNMYDHTLRVPLIFRGPGIPRQKQTSALCYLRDLYPTLCEYAGAPIPESVQGKSLLPILRGEKDQIYGEVFAYFLGVQRAIKTPEWKYIRYSRANREQLFDLKHDPDELKDLSGDPAYVRTVIKLRTRLDEFEKSCR